MDYKGYYGYNKYLINYYTISYSSISVCYKVDLSSFLLILIRDKKHNMKPKDITLSDIAQKLGVSIITVSKALRGHPDISSHTAELIKKAALELGYSPNFMARNLASRKSNTIGVVLPEIAHHFFSSIIDHIYIYATLNNYQIFLTVSQENSELQKKTNPDSSFDES